MKGDEDEDNIAPGGLFGRVVNAVNTTKDIAYVIWNIRWI